MEFHVIHSGLFKLDGGAMFGVVPKQMWAPLVPPDERNLCTWAMRLLLVEHGNRLLLVDTGIGNKQSEKFFSHYHLHGDMSLDGELAARGFSRADITDVLLTHLHFDHVGGAVERRASDGALRPAFPRATFWSTERHWDWAVNPNPREKASFLTENLMPLSESGQLQFIERTGRWLQEPLGEAFPGMDLFFADGHTESQMIPVFTRPDGARLAFMGDLLASAAHVPAAWVMGYDTRPLLTMDDKAEFLGRAAAESWILMLEHDAAHEGCRVHETEKGIRLQTASPKLMDL